MGRIEKIGDATLHLGDCREIMPTLGTMAACVTDPPYGIGISANPVRQKHRRLDWDSVAPSRDVFGAIADLTTWQIIWGGNYFDLPPSQGFFVWDKVQPQEFSLAMCEQAWTNIQAPAKLFRRHVVSFEKHHPTQKPLELMLWCIDRLPEPNDTIFDPFMGSGTTGVAAAKKGRFFVGIERDEGYFDTACRRIEEAYKQPDLFISQPSQPKPEQLAML